MDSDNNDPLSQFVTLTLDLRQAEDRVANLKAELRTLQEGILEDWANHGIQRITTDHGTVSIRHDFYCSKKAGVSTDTVLAILQQVGLAELSELTYNSARLKARVKEWFESGAVPEELTAVLNYDTIPRLTLLAK